MGAASTIAYSVMAAASVYSAYSADEGRKKQEKAAEEEKAKRDKQLAQQQADQLKKEQQENNLMSAEAEEGSGPSLRTASQTNRSSRVRRDTLSPKGLSIPSGPAKSGLNIGYAKG